MISILRDLVFHDFLLKLFSLALAVLIWFTITEVQKESSPLPRLTMNADVRTFSGLPVLVVCSAEEVRNFKITPSEVELTVQGDTRILDKLSNKDFRVTVDLTGIEAVSGPLRKRVDVSTPAGVTHSRAEPLEVQIRVPPRP
jgi:YbbR domain-containing protein